MTRDDFMALDAADTLRELRDEFVLPESVIYLLGNSLGPLPRRAIERVARTVETEWGLLLSESWNASGWWDLPATTGDRIAPLIGAGPGEVLVCDSTSVAIFKVVSAALRLRPGRRVIVSDAGNFPTDHYVVEGVADAFGYEVRDVAEPLRDDVGAVLLSHVDYRTGAMRDMAAVTDQAHAVGALMIWDLCHSAGAVPVDVTAADFAVGCTYKYLNGGPGAPAYLYLNPRHEDAVNVISGWHGHAAPFDFEPGYRPAEGVRRFASGTPPVLSYGALNAALDVWEKADLNALRAKSLALTEQFMDLVDPALKIVTPRDPAARGSQVSIRHPNGYPVVRALVDRGVIGDFRAPDIMRFGFAPLYIRHVDVFDAATLLNEVLEKESWRDERYAGRRLTVT
ncbi:kynureninase [Streptosporangiaceae bacterium NEAU-GS5]|nr:kynureninase [Streptosporangiaceae bacterium NEAU-GS5]